jgi:hypothetical protein
MRQGGKTYIGHSGVAAGYRTQLHICPSDKIAVIVLTNADDGNPLMYVEKAFQWVTPPILKIVTPEPESSRTRPSLAAVRRQISQSLGRLASAHSQWRARDD